MSSRCLKLDGETLELVLLPKLVRHKALFLSSVLAVSLSTDCVVSSYPSNRSDAKIKKKRKEKENKAILAIFGLSRLKTLTAERRSGEKMKTQIRTRPETNECLVCLVIGSSTPILHAVSRGWHGNGICTLPDLGFNVGCVGVCEQEDIFFLVVILSTLIAFFFN